MSLGLKCKINSKISTKGFPKRGRSGGGSVIWEKFPNNTVTPIVMFVLSCSVHLSMSIQALLFLAVPENPLFKPNCLSPIYKLECAKTVPKLCQNCAVCLLASWRAKTTGAKGRNSPPQCSQQSAHHSLNSLQSSFLIAC